MPGILSIRICKKCEKHLLRDPSISGDYNEEGILQSYCPICGDMYPVMFDASYYIPLSNRKLKQLMARCATAYNLSYRETNNMLTRLQGFNRKKAFDRLRDEMVERYKIEIPPEVFVGI